MAATVLAPLAISLIPEGVKLIVQLVDKWIGGKTTTNPDMGTAVKFPLADTLLQALEKTLIAIGQGIASSQPQRAGAIQNAFNELDSKSLLNGHDTVVGAGVSLPMSDVRLDKFLNILDNISSKL